MSTNAQKRTLHLGGWSVFSEESCLISGFNVDSVVLTVVRDVPVEAGYTIDNAVIHNIDYSVSVTEPLTADLTAESIKSRFDALMKSSSQTYAMQFAKDRKPPVVSYTILDLVQGPQNRRSHDSYSKSFVVYGNIGLKYNSKRERNQILERIRHLWEDAAGAFWMVQCHGTMGTTIE